MNPITNLDKPKHGKESRPGDHSHKYHTQACDKHLWQLHKNTNRMELKPAGLSTLQRRQMEHTDLYLSLR